MTDAKDKTPLLELRGVSKSYDDMPAVVGVDLSFKRGEFVAVMGSSGCGKTTLIRILAGLESPDAGDVEMNGARINDLPAWQRRTPMVWQNLALFPFLNVLENVEFGLKMRGIEKSKRRLQSMAWLEKLELGKFSHATVTKLSGGQLQRVALARTLVLQPEMLLLDEPLSALDANMVVHMQGVLSRLQKDVGITFLYVTHSRSEAFSMADRVVVMNHGRIEQIGTPREIYHTPKNRFVAGFIGANNIFDGEVVGVQGGCVQIKTAGGVFRALTPPNVPQVGDAVEFVVAAADMEISTSGGAVSCALTGEEFIGGFVMLHLKSKCGMKLMAQINADKLRELDGLRGREIWISWSEEKTHVLSQYTGASQ